MANTSIVHRTTLMGLEERLTSILTLMFARAILFKENLKDLAGRSVSTLMEDITMKLGSLARVNFMGMERV